MSSYDFVQWGGRSRLDNIEQELNSLKGAGVIGPAVFFNSGTAAAGTGAGRYPVPSATTIKHVLATAATAPTGADLIFDVNLNGTTIFTTQSNRPTISATTHAQSATPTPDTTAVAAGDYLTVDIDQIGSTVAGSDIVVMVVFG